MMVVLREQAELPALGTFEKAVTSFLEDAKTKGLVREKLSAGLVSGMILDRVMNQAQFAPWLKANHGIDLYNDAAYRRDWCRSNADLILFGLVTR